MNRTEKSLGEQKLIVKHQAMIIDEYRHWCSNACRLIDEHQSFIRSKYNKEPSRKFNDIMGMLKAALDFDKRQKKRLSAELVREFKDGIKDLDNYTNDSTGESNEEST